MKQVSSAIKSFVLSSPRHSVPQRGALSKCLLVLLLAGFAIFSSSCQKEKSVPFKGKMHLIVKGNTVSGTGTASHIGRFTIVEPNNLVQRIDEHTLSVTGTATITAANGDEIFATHRGIVKLHDDGTADVNAEFTITGGTGRFAGATGSFQVHSLPNPGDYTLNGTISY